MVCGGKKTFSTALQTKEIFQSVAVDSGCTLLKDRFGEKSRLLVQRRFSLTIIYCAPALVLSFGLCPRKNNSQIVRGNIRDWFCSNLFRRFGVRRQIRRV